MLTYRGWHHRLRTVSSGLLTALTISASGTAFAGQFDLIPVSATATYAGYASARFREGVGDMRSLPNSHGQFVFARERGNDSRQAIYFGDARGAITTLVGQGGRTPDGGGWFGYEGSSPKSLTINEAGVAGFFGRSMLGATVQQTGIYTGNRDGEVRQLVRVGLEAPDSGTFRAFNTGALDLNEKGQAAFLALTSASGGAEGLFIHDGTAGSLIAFAGMETAQGTLGAPLADLALNNAGQVAFVAALGGGEGTHIFLGGNAAEPARVLGTGDSFLGSTIERVSDVQLNDRGEVGFSYVLSDGRDGAGMARPSELLRGPQGSVANPEPGSGVLFFAAAIGMLGLLAGRRRLR